MLFIICRSIGKTICSAHFLVGVRPSCDGISVSGDSVTQKRRLVRPSCDGLSVSEHSVIQKQRSDWLGCDGISVSVDSVTQKRRSDWLGCDGISVSEDSVIQKRRLDRLSCDGISVSGKSVTSGGMKQSDPTVGEIDRSPRGALHRKICAEKPTEQEAKKNHRKTAGSAGGFDGYTI